MRLQFLVYFVLIAVISGVLWVFSQNVSTGYVVEAEDGAVKLVQLQADPLFPMTQEERLEALKQAARTKDASIFTLPVVNEKIGSTYTFGEKVRIYWYGETATNNRKQQVVEQTLFIMR